MNRTSNPNFRFLKLLPNFVNENDPLDNFNPELFEFQDPNLKKRKLNEYRKYLKINTFKSPSKTTYCFREMYTSMIGLHELVRNIHHNQTNQYRINILLGYILENIETGEIKFYSPSYNTSIYAENVKPLINTSVSELLESMNENIIVEELKRPHSKWKFVEIYEFIILITPIPNLLIGAKILLPVYIKNKDSIIGFADAENNLCFWFCLEKHLNKNTKRLDRMKKQVKKRFQQYYGNKKLVKSYSGVDMNEIEEIEEFYKLNINIYSILAENSTEMIRHSQKEFKDIMSLNLYQNHFSLITNINNITKNFKCGDCGTFLSQFKLLKRHAKTCQKGEQKMQFIGGKYENKKTIFELLEDENIFIPNALRYYPTFIFFDFETYLKQNLIKREKLQYEGEHSLLSISFMGNDDENPTFIPVETTPELALEKMIIKMDETRVKYIERIYKSYETFFNDINKLEDEKDKKMLRNKLIDWIEVMPVYGWNSSSYDLNVIKKYLPEILMKHGKKHGNISKIEKQWIATIEKELGYKIEKNKKIDRYSVDGFDKGTNTVYEFNGCFFHGCQLCNVTEYKYKAFGDNMTKDNLYKKTMEKKSNLENLGFSVISKWECEFKCPEGIEVTGIIKQNNRYRMISNGAFIFKDAMNYLAPGTSLEKFLTAFDTKAAKGIFCHKVTQNLKKFVKEKPELEGCAGVIDILKKSQIPKQEWFYDDLKRTKNYEIIKSKYCSIYDLLEYYLEDYNNLDVEPSIEAITKLIKFFKEKGLDCHKDGISISGLTLKYLWNVKDDDADFHLFLGNEELFHKYKANLVGGPSIVLNHYQEKEKTKIRGGKICQGIKGYDANALY